MVDGALSRLIICPFNSDAGGWIELLNKWTEKKKKLKKLIANLALAVIDSKKFLNELFIICYN